MTIFLTSINTEALKYQNVKGKHCMSQTDIAIDYKMQRHWYQTRGLYARYIFNCCPDCSATCIPGSCTVQFSRYFPCSPCLHIYSCSVQNDHSHFEVNSLFLQCYCHEKNTHHQTEWVLLLFNMLDPSQTGLVPALSMGHAWSAPALCSCVLLLSFVCGAMWTHLCLAKEDLWRDRAGLLCPFKPPQ